MDHTATPSRIDHQPSSTILHVGPSPDPESSRGRPRRRDPLNPFTLARHSRHHHPSSRESSTLRGRCRHRSLSRIIINNTTTTTTTNLVTSSTTTSALSSRGRSSHHQRRGHSPAEKRRALLLLPSGVAVRRRRGQSPSRSRSPGVGGGRGVNAVAVVDAAEGLLAVCLMASGQRRRQRTQSRSRRHGLEGAFASVAVAGRSRLDGDVNGKD